jgi:hypothetical protein
MNSRKLKHLDCRNVVGVVVGNLDSNKVTYLCEAPNTRATIRAIYKR